MQTPKRVVVDGIDVMEILRFPRLLGSVTAAMQPPRLVVGLLVVALLLCGGGLWDSLRAPTISPKGLDAPIWKPEDTKRANDLLRQYLREYKVPEDLRPEGWQEANLSANPGKVVDLISTSYRETRHASEVENSTENLAANDRRFLLAVKSIDEATPHGTFDATTRHVVKSVQRIISGVGLLKVEEVFGGFGDLFIDLPMGLWRNDPWFTVIYGLYFAAVISLGGGALSRMAACEFAGREKLRVRDGVDFAIRHWPNLIGAQMLPVLLSLLLGLVIVVLGSFMTLPFLDVVGGLLYGVALVLGFLVAFLMVGYAVSFPMLLPAVACENCDAGDALTRSYAYLLTKPLHLAWYLLVAVAGAALGYVVVAGVIVVTLNGTAWLFGALNNNSAMTAAGGFELFDLSQQAPTEIHSAWHNSTSAWLLSMWQSTLIGLVGAYVTAYIFDSFTRMYLLMRLASDGQGTQEIWRAREIAGTMVARPAVVEAKEALVVVSKPSTPEQSSGRVERAAAAMMRGVAAVRLGAPVRLKAVKPPASDAATTDQLGPELIPDQDRRVAGVEKHSDRE